MKFELEDTIRGASDEDIFQDLRRCAELLGKNTITYAEYQNAGRASSGTVTRRFGTWNSALEKAGLSVKNQRDISIEDLFENIEQMWVKLGRQPRYSEVKYPFSKYSNVTYDKRFGKYSEALKQFVVWVNSDEEPLQENEIVSN